MLGFILFLMDSAQDEEKFNLIYKKYINYIFLITSNYFEKQYDKEDVVYNALLKIALNIDKIDDIGSNATKKYIAIIVKNTCLTSVKNKNKIKEVSFDMIDESKISRNTTEENVDYNELLNIYSKALMKLNDEYYEIVYLSYSFGMKNKDIADTLGISSKSVTQKLSRAKAQLREYIGKELQYNE